jgi:hypothetical protein
VLRGPLKTLSATVDQAAMHSEFGGKELRAKIVAGYGRHNGLPEWTALGCAQTTIPDAKTDPRPATPISK